MSEGEPIGIENIEKRKLTEEEQRAKDLFFQSFRFSQGEEEIQDDILKWLVAKGYFDTIEIPEETPDYIKEIAVPAKHKSLEGVSNYDRLNTLETFWFSLYRDKRDKQSLSAEELLAPMLAKMRMA
jgi:hypothetical protein